MSNLDVNNLPRQVWAFYHPFYGTPDGPTGRWLTWNEPLRLARGYGAPAFLPPPEVDERLQHNPDDLLGPGRRSNYSVYYPTLGLYDCLDPAVLEQHARWAVEASLDGLLWDYMLVGEDNPDKDKPLQDSIYDRSLRIMLDVVWRLRLPLDLCLWYDSFCWYGFPVEKIAEQLTHLVRTYRGHPDLLHFNGRLVVYIYAALNKHSIEDWWQVRELLRHSGVARNAFLVAGEVFVHNPDYHAPELFDGFQLYNYGMDNWSPEGVHETCETLRRLTEANGTKFWSVPVGPGFDGRIWHHPGRVVTRGLGKLYEAMWEQAIKEAPQFITVCSFNEWGEGTQIEPCLEYDDLYLKLTAKWAQAFRQTQWQR
jgi:glycoprotein endo-alpha-1,2-mannosidase